MKELVLKVYIQYKKVLYNIYSFCMLILFLAFVIKVNTFGKGNPKDSLLILEEYLKLNAFSYSSERRMGRSLRTSLNLFSILINKYLETNSAITLNQVISVLVEEFLRRGENNGRK